MAAPPAALLIDHVLLEDFAHCDERAAKSAEAGDFTKPL